MHIVPQHRFSRTETIQVSSHLLQTTKKQWLNGYVLFDKEMFFKLFPAFKDKPAQVNVDGFLNEPESSFFLI